MTTERPAPARPGKPPPKLDLSPIEWKLALATVLSAVYLAVFALLPTPPPASGEPTEALVADTLPPAEGGSAAADPRAALPRGLPRGAVWIDALPPEARPVVEIPAGYRRVTTGAPPDPGRTTTVAPSAPRRASVVAHARPRRPRVRTRSS